VIVGGDNAIAYGISFGITAGIILGVIYEELKGKKSD